MDWIRRDRLILAPMAGISSFALRQAFAEKGWFAGWIGSVDCAAVVRLGNGRPVNMLGREEQPGPRPCVIQLISNRAEEILEAMRLLDEAADAFDINLGCPLDMAVDKGTGSALLSEPETMTALLRAATAGSGKPVLAKLRLPEGGLKDPAGWARRLEDTGVAALVVHGRKPSQGFRGPADWAALGAMKAAVRVPVVANGGLRTVADIQACLADTGSDAVMLGAGALRNPLLAEEYAGFLKTGRPASGRLLRNKVRFATSYSRPSPSGTAPEGRGRFSVLRFLGFFVLWARVESFVLRHSR